MPYYVISSRENGSGKDEVTYMHENGAQKAIDLFLLNAKLNRYEFDILDVQEISTIEYELIKKQEHGTKGQHRSDIQE